MRLTLFCLVSLILIVPATAQSVQNPLPLEQTQNDVTLRVTKAGFFGAKETFSGNRAWGKAESARPSFRVSYRLQNAKTQETKTPNLSAYREYTDRADATIVRLFAPSGELLNASSGASMVDGEQHLMWVCVDPRWDHVTMEVLALDPAAPLEAAGRFSETLTFKDVTLPHSLDKVQPIGAILRTARGTAVTLDSVTLQKGEKVRLEFAFHWEAPRAVPDLIMQADLQSVLDAQGKALTSNSGGSSGGRQFTIHRDLLSMPAPGDVSVTINVNERADALRQKQHYRRFRCDLKLPAATNLTANSDPAAQVAQTGNVIAALEKARWLGEPSRLATWLWLRGRESVPATGATQEWFISNLAARDQDGRKLEATWHENIQNDENHLAWRSDGVPAAPGERSQFLRIEWGATRPLRVLLEAKVHEKLHRHRVADFADVPIPAPGQTREINAVVAASAAGDAPGASVILRRIARVADPKPAAFFPGWPRQDLRAGSLALVFEVVPALAQGTVDFRGMFAENDAGVPLHDENRIALEAGDVTGSSKGKGWLRTMLLHPPLPGAKSLRVQVVVDETRATGKEATLLFPDVPLPTP